MTPEQQLADAEANYTIANTAYKKALAAMQYVQTGQRRMATHDLEALLKSVTYWRDQANALSATVNKTVRPNIIGPLRVNL
jgi:hypothetical protein